MEGLLSLLTPAALGSLLTLTLMEVVLGIDNIVFLSILVGKLPKEQQKKTRQIGLFLAMFMRIGLLFTISWMMSLEAELFSLPWKIGGLDLSFSGRDLILLGGGLFLLAKATHEIYDKLEGAHHEEAKTGSA